MNKQINKIYFILSSLGFNREEIKTYLALIDYGELTVLTISRIIALPRTTVYRILDKLEKIGIVEEEIDQNKKKFIANTKNISLLIKKREDEIKKIHKLLPYVENLLYRSNKSF